MSASQFDRHNAARLEWAFHALGWETYDRLRSERAISCERAYDLSLGLVGHDGGTPHRRGCGEGMRTIDFSIRYAVALKRAVAPSGVGGRARHNRGRVWSAVADEGKRLATTLREEVAATSA